MFRDSRWPGTDLGAALASNKVLNLTLVLTILDEVVL